MIVQIQGIKKTGKKYWRSLEELADTAQFRDWVGKEFPASSMDMEDGNSRRRFLNIMAASMGLAGLTACRRPVEHILPYAKSVEEQIPGVPLQYASIFTLGTRVQGLVVESSDGRPTKIEGNKKHPNSLGAASGFAQASVLNLYDPDRSQTVLSSGKNSSWEKFAEFAKTQSWGDGSGVRILSQAVTSPTLAALRGELLAKYPQASWTEYEAINEDAALAGSELAYGQRVRPVYSMDKAKIILSLDSDFLLHDSPGLEVTRGFARGRRDSEGLSRLYVAESNYSITGAQADHRLRLKPSEVLAFAADLAREVGALPQGLKILGQDGKFGKWTTAVAKDLIEHKGSALVVAGDRQPAAVHALAALLNQSLGAIGTTINYVKQDRPAMAASISKLATELAAGTVKTLLILGGNPIYDAPANTMFAESVKKAGLVIHLGAETNETAQASTWHLPQSHFLESWGDAFADGSASIQQPLIEPLFGTKSAIEVVSMLLGHSGKAHDAVKAQWKLDEKSWRRALHDGVIETIKTDFVKVGADAKRIEAVVNSAPKPSASMEVAFFPSATSYDGRFANNGWLQEAPEPMTKLVWDNAGIVSPKTAKALNVETGDMIAITVSGKSVSVPAMILPGHAENTVSVSLGYGRKEVGRVGKEVGVNVYPIRTSSGMGFSDAQIAKGSGTHKLVTTQEHFSMEARPIVREAKVEDYSHHKNFATHEDEHTEEYSIYGYHEYNKGNQWGLVVDLNSCVGCNACITACQAENNIPIVGKDQVGKGREMHWIRLDRYFSAESEDANHIAVDDPQVVYQPMACQQCETAPCEAVCPVAATTHSPEGLNDMAYNRCVGTRYCANNCPFKVRRFNYLNWHKDIEETTKMVFNPNVTVRMRGIMEKCTYCVQRVQEKKIQAKVEGRRELRDGEIQTACQQTCPAEAITFGNINDPNSAVSKLKKKDLNYGLLKELNLKPRTSYLAKLRNPNPELA